MCRYILAVPPSDKDPVHNLRMIFGNGLRPQIWTEFIQRFHIDNVREFYGATEGNANIGKTSFYSKLFRDLVTTRVLYFFEILNRILHNELL